METETSVSLAESSPGVVQRILYTCEDTLSVFFAVVWGLLASAILSFFAVAVIQQPGGWPLAIGASVLVAAEVSFLVAMKSFLESGVRPFVSQFLSRQPDWPLVVRPLVSAWWAAHFAIGMAALVGVYALDVTGEARWWVVALRIIGFEMGVFTISHSAQLYLLLAIGAVWRKQDQIDWIWRRRFVLDALAMIGGLVVILRAAST